MGKTLIGQILVLAGCVGFAVAIFYSAGWVRGTVLASAVAVCVGWFMQQRT